MAGHLHWSFGICVSNEAAVCAHLAAILENTTNAQLPTPYALTTLLSLVATEA